ncbi:MAG: type IV pilin protein [Congregibacter sp.]
MRRREQQKGFTLIELMIVVVVLGILVSIALPSYQDSVVRSGRADAQAVLLGFAQAMERHFNQNYTYVGAAVGGVAVGAPAPTVYSAQAPIDGNAFYNLTISAADATGFTIRATPVAGGRQDGDGLLELDSLGRRAWDADNDGTIAAAEFTWER